MLFFLAGDVQTGKTRWLMRLIDQLEAHGVEPCGVVAPGIWVPRDDGFEKLGIDNLLLPERQTLSFARRRDLAQAEGAYDAKSQAARAGLGWAIDDAALARVNSHFAELAQVNDAGKRMLIVDELGRLELAGGAGGTDSAGSTSSTIDANGTSKVSGTGGAGGLADAVALLERGATAAFPHALVVVRSQLLKAAHGRFENIPWGGMRDISPDENSFQAVLDLAG